MAPGHGVEETFAPICPGVQPKATFHYEGHHAEANPFNFLSYPISCNFEEGCPPEVPYHQDASSVLEAQVQVVQHKVYHSGLVDLYQERQIQVLWKEVEDLKLANQQLAQVGIKTWVSNAIICRNLEHFIGAHYFSLIQSLGETLLGVCPEGKLRSGGSPAPSESSLPPLEESFPSAFCKSGFISRGPSPTWINDFLAGSINFLCPEVMAFQSLCGPLF